MIRLLLIGSKNGAKHVVSLEITKLAALVLVSSTAPVGSSDSRKQPFLTRFSTVKKIRKAPLTLIVFKIPAQAPNLISGQ